MWVGGVESETSPPRWGSADGADDCVSAVGGVVPTVAGCPLKEFARSFRGIVTGGDGPLSYGPFAGIGIGGEPRES